MKTEEMSPVIEQLVQDQLSTGKYQSRDEVLVRALRNLAEHDQFMADLEAAAEDETAGRFRDADEVMAEMAERFNLVNTP